MAKEQKQEQKSAPAPEIVPEAVGPPKSYRLQITLALVSLILFQMAVLWVLLPPRNVVQKHIGTNVLNGVEGFDDPNIVPEDIGNKIPMVERQIGEKEFKVKNVHNEANETFSLTMHVKVRKADAKKFDARYLICMNEIIDRVTGILHASTPQERGEVGLAAIKEKAKRAINAVLGTPWVQEVLCSNPSFESQ